MGLLERMGLVERDGLSDLNCQSITMPSMEIEADVKDVEDVVNAIYEQNGLSDKSTSIYTVQALISTLPQEMPTPTMQTTVAGILAVSGKDVHDLLNDATRRLETLAAARSKIVGERGTEIAEAENDIERLKEMIGQAQVKIHEAEGVIEATKRDIDAECDAISSLVSFCNGMTGGAA